MKFVCDSCHAQYLINDEKVGPNGVIVRCKKCQHKIVVKRPAPPPEEGEQTIIAGNPIVDDGQLPADGAPPSGESAAPPVPPPPASGIDDELGRAFESVLSHQSAIPDTTPGVDLSSRPTQAEMPLAASSAGEAPTGTGEPPADEGDSDRQSTRVVNLAEMANMMKAEAQHEAEQANAAAAAAAAASVAAAEKTEERPKKNGANGTPVAGAGADWFVAINESQVGPLNFEGVREKWDKGELSADSLCWKPGMPDWKPLSLVPELGEKLAPRPTPADKEAPAGATATGAQAAASAPLPPQQEEPGEPEWKPSAANALESLVKDELEALQKPAPKAEEPAPAGDAKPHGLFDELPDISEKPEAPAEPALPRRAQAPVEDDAPPAYEQPRRPATRPPSYAAPAADYEPPMYQPPKSRTGLIVGAAVGGLVVICATVIVVVMMMRPPQQALQPQPPVVAPQPVPQPPVVAQPVPQPPVVAQPTPPPEPKVDKPAEVKAADKVEPKPEPEKVAAGDAKNPKKEGVSALPGEHGGPGTGKVPLKGQKHPGQVASNEPTPKEPVVKPEPSEPAPAPTPKPTGKKVDDEFDSIFGGGGDKAAAPAAEKPAKNTPHKDVYIPPAPGSGGANTPAPAAAAKPSLEQSDIMEVVLANRPAIKKCTEEAKAKDPSASGTIVMRWTILPGGGTSNVQTKTPEFQHTPLSACLAGMIKGFHFPAYSGAQMSPIEFPFKF